MNVSVSGTGPACSSWAMFLSRHISKHLPKNESRFHDICLNSSLLGPSSGAPCFGPGLDSPCASWTQSGALWIEAAGGKAQAHRMAPRAPPGEDKDPVCAVPCGVLGFNPVPSCLPGITPSSSLILKSPLRLRLLPEQVRA